MKQTLLKVFLSMTAVLLFGLNVSAQETTGNQSTRPDYFTSTLPTDYSNIKFYLAVSGVDGAGKQTTVSATVYDNENDYDFKVLLPVSGYQVRPTKATIESLMHNVASLNVGKNEVRKYKQEINIQDVESVSPQTLGAGANNWLTHCYNFPTTKTLPIKVIDYNHPQASTYPEKYNFYYTITRTTKDDGSVELYGKASNITDAHNAWYLITKGYTNNHVTASQRNDGDSRVVLPAGTYIQLGNEKLTVNNDVSLSEGVFNMQSMSSLINQKSTLSSVDNPENKAIIYLPAGTSLSMSSSIATLNEDAKITIDLKDVKSVTLNGVLSTIKNASSSNYNLLQALLKMFDNLVYMVGISENPQITVQFGEPTEKYIQVYKGVSTPEPNLMSHEEFAKVLQSYPNSVGYVRTQFATPAHIEESTAEGVKNVVIEYSVGKFGYKFYESSNLVLVDYEAGVTEKVDFYTPEDFTAVKLSYSRKDTRDYNSVCLPFAISSNDGIGTIWTFSNYNETDETKGDTRQVYFTDRSDEGVNAGVPCIVKSSVDSWSITQENAQIVATPIASTNMQGTYADKKIGTGHYKLNSAGDHFQETVETSYCFAFRAYLDIDEDMGVNHDAKLRTLSAVWGDATSVSSVPTSNNTIQSVYSVNGSKMNTLNKGVNIVKMVDGTIRKIVK